MTSKITEPEVASQLASELDERIRRGGTPFQKASVEHSVGVGRPDIVIWTDYAGKRAFAFWELKRPNRQEDLDRLPKKAKALGVCYVVVWNFQYGELYEVQDGDLRSLRSYPSPLLASLEEWANPTKRSAVLVQAERILDDLARLAQGQSLTPYTPDKFYFIGVLQKAIHSLLPVLQEHLLHKQKERAVHKAILDWAVQQGYPTGLPHLDELLARHWAYSLAVRILFYFTVRRYHPGLPDLQAATRGGPPVADLLYDAFSKAQSVDWQAVFEPSPLDRLGLPQKADPILRELLEDFHRYDFGLLKEDVIGQIMEGLIPEEERHALGQYFTPEDLVDLIVGFVANRDQAFYLDPTCGSGTFLNRLYSRLRWLSGYRSTHAQLLERLWGVDVAHFPAELATINLFRQDVKDLSNFPRIVVQDFFDARPGQKFFFPPLKAQPGLEQQRIEVSIPAFHGIVGNFPYIRQELIERQVKGYKGKIVQAIAREWFWQEPSLFALRGLSQRDLEHIQQRDPQGRQRWLDEQVSKGRVDLRLSGQADIYAYLFYHAAAFLEEGGRLGIVTSNAWLDVAYGEELKRFFLRHFKIIAIVASWCEPWFEDAAVNTAFTILERCEDAEERHKNVVRFVKVKKPLSEVLPRDLLLREAERWQKVDALVRQIEAADAQVARWDPSSGRVAPLRGVHTVETEDFRIRLVPQAELEAELARKGETAKWGLYIRAPQVYFDLLEAAGDKLIPLSQVAEVRRGYTTGINDFFYLEPLGPGSAPGALRVKNARGWVGEIEGECLRPVIKSPKEAQGLEVDPAKLKYRLFLPPIAAASADPEKELRARYPLAYAYVRWGEQQQTPQGQPWPQVPSVRGRKAWWLIPEKVPGSILMPRLTDVRFIILDNREKALVDHNLCELLTASSKESPLRAGLMNSTLFTLMWEIAGRINLGDGALNTETIEWKFGALVPDPLQIELGKQQRIISAYQVLKQRPVKPIAQEVKQKDRRALDEAVLEALGLEPQEYLPRIYAGLVEMVQERLELPKKRAARQKGEKRLSLEQIGEKVRREMLPGGLKPISSFVPKGTEMEKISLTGRPLSWRPFLSELTLVDERNRDVGVVRGDENRARYAVHAARPGEYTLEVPSSSIAAGKAVQDYERYLRQVGQDLYGRLLEATHEHKQAERAAREILESLGLPPLAVEKAMGD